MAINFMYTSGIWMKAYRFLNLAVQVRWVGHVGRIKAEIEDINNDGNAGAPRVPKYHFWLLSVYDFIEEWGEAHLPPDIKHAVNDVQENLGLPAHVWADPPANNLLADHLAAMRGQPQPPAGQPPADGE